jgi:hypothetical protein
MARPITTETRLRNRVRQLETLVDSWPVTQHHPEIWDYLEHLAALSHIALNGIRRPDDLGGTISGTHPTSTGTRTENHAYHAQLKVELAHLKQRSRMLEGELNRLDRVKAQEIA